MRTLNFALVLLTALVCFGIYRVAEDARVAHASLVMTERQIAHEHQTLVVLGRGVGRRSRGPQRIQALAERHLDLADAPVVELSRSRMLPRRGEAPAHRSGRCATRAPSCRTSPRFAMTSLSPGRSSAPPTVRAHEHRRRTSARPEPDRAGRDFLRLRLCACRRTPCRRHGVRRHCARHRAVSPRIRAPIRADIVDRNGVLLARDLARQRPLRVARRVLGYARGGARTRRRARRRRGASCARAFASEPRLRRGQARHHAG